LIWPSLFRPGKKLTKIRGALERELRYLCNQRYSSYLSPYFHPNLKMFQKRFGYPSLVHSTD
jgi:hypothetical protein